MNIYDQLRRDEGFRAHPYRCSEGVLTIGYGRNISESGAGLYEAEASFMLRGDITRAELDLERIFKNWQKIDQVRRNALINMRFQLGAGGFRSFHNMIQSVNKWKWDLACSHALDSLWASQTPRRAYRIAEELRTGISQ